MKIKMFISYSHKDEKHKNDLEEHLTMLKRNKIIETWNDRMITPGSNWEDDIDEHLDNADIVLYLVSSSFLASNYCYCKEFESILTKYKEGKCLIIPIIVRTCNWTDSPLGKIQSLPRDGNAITSWNDIDAGWTSVIDGIKIAIESLKEKPPTYIENNISLSFNNFLNETCIPLYKEGSQIVSLQDIYIAPDLIELNTTVRTKKFDISKIYQDGKYIVYGDEKSGKSSLLKWIFKEINKLKREAIYIDMSDISSLKNKDEVLNKFYKSIYSKNINIDASILIDNFDKTNCLNKKSRMEFINYINLKFENIIISFDTDNSFLKEELECFNDYIELKIKNFGFEKREEIIRKWYSIGVDESISDEELYKKVDEAKDKVNSILLKNILPARPMYILLILNLLESKGNVEFTSYGHCYQQLIYQSFDNVNIKKLDFDKYINILKELSWELFLLNDKINEKNLHNFFDKYEKEYLSVNREIILKKMREAQIISFNGYEYSFKYQYIYYFFIGKKISESYSIDKSVQEKVDEIFNKIYKDDYATILVFINHHNRDPWLTDRITSILDSLFSDVEEATLDRDGLNFMKNFYENIPSMIIESKTDIQETRKKRNIELDLIEEENSRKSYSKEDEYDIPLFKDIQALFKGIEIVGQIIRNRHSSIKRNELLNIVQSGISGGLRFLNYFIKVSDVTKNRAVNYIHDILSKESIISDTELKRKVEYFYLSLIYKIIFIIMKKIADSIGSKEATEIYSLLSQEKNTVALKLINEEILLNFSKNFSPSRVESLKNTFNGNEIATLILREIILNYLEMFPVEYKEKQRVANIIGINMKGVNLISNNQNK